MLNMWCRAIVFFLRNQQPDPSAHRYLEYQADCRRVME